VSHQVLSDPAPAKWIDFLDQCADCLHVDFGQCQAVSLVWYILNADLYAAPPPHPVDLLECLDGDIRSEALRRLLDRDQWPLSDDERRRIAELL
jgi:hypothetical protein